MYISCQYWIHYCSTPAYEVVDGVCESRSLFFTLIIPFQVMQDSTPDILRNAVYTGDSTELSGTSQLQTIEVKPPYHVQECNENPLRLPLYNTMMFVVHVYI